MSGCRVTLAQCPGCDSPDLLCCPRPHPSILNNSCQLSPLLFLFLWVLSNLCTHRRQQRLLNMNAKWGLLLFCIFSIWCLNNGFISIYDVGMNKETSSLHPNILPVGLSWLSQYTYTCTRLLLEGGQIILSQANSNIYLHFQSCWLLSHHLIHISIISSWSMYKRF